LRRLGLLRPELTDDDVAWIERLAEEVRAAPLVDSLPAAQRDAIRAHVIEQRDYDDIAATAHMSEAVVRKRVSRGLAAVRRRMGASE
jgi:RNA polymerase sigma-70 factor (ECF subfamily)